VPGVWRPAAPRGVEPSSLVASTDNDAAQGTRLVGASPVIGRARLAISSGSLTLQPVPS
jgi:hypothetical protein